MENKITKKINEYLQSNKYWQSSKEYVVPIGFCLAATVALWSAVEVTTKIYDSFTSNVQNTPKSSQSKTVNYEPRHTRQDSINQILIDNYNHSQKNKEQVNETNNNQKPKTVITDTSLNNLLEKYTR